MTNKYLHYRDKYLNILMDWNKIIKFNFLIYFLNILNLKLTPLILKN